jgi:hypothetical protein
MSAPILNRHALQRPDSNMTTADVAPVVSLRRQERDPKICPTDDEAIIPKADRSRKLDKQSWEYVVKSGLAGGLAGCAVCASFPEYCCSY